MTVKRTITFLAALAGIAIAIACGGSDSFGISGTLFGTCSGGVTVTVTGMASGTATSDASGRYEVTGLPNGTYTVTPSKAGCSFSPPALAVVVDGKVAAGNDFSANTN